MRRHQCRSGSRCKLGLLFRESHGWPSRCSLLVLLIFLVNQDRLPSKRLREWSEVTAKRRRTGSWHCPPLVSPRADTAGRSLLAKRRDSEARSASQLVDAGSKKPAHSDAKKAVAGSLSKASDQSDSEESNDTGSDGEAEADGQTVGGKAQDDAIEVKDAETLWRVNIEAVYRRKNPKLLSKVSELIAKYKANGTPLSHLYAKVCRTYELDPKVMWATRSEAEEDEGDADGACFKDNAFEEGEAKDGPSGPSGAAKPEASNSTSSMVPGSIFGDSLGLAAAGKPADGDAQSASSSSIFTFGAAKPPDSSTGGLFSASDAKPSTDIFRFGAEPAQSGSSASGSLFAPVGTGGSIFGDATAGSAANIQSGSQSASPSDIFASLFGASSGSSSASSGSSGIFGATSGSSSIFGNSGAVPGESANSGASSILGSSGSIFGAGSSGASSIFGASSGSASNIFASSGPGAGPSTGASIFGESSAPSIFGGSSSGSNPGASGSSSIFGANTGGGSSMFGANTASSSNIFGASSGSSDMFVAASGGGSNIFGATSGGGPPVFGATSGGGHLWAQASLVQLREEAQESLVRLREEVPLCLERLREEAQASLVQLREEAQASLVRLREQVPMCLVRLREEAQASLVQLREEAQVSLVRLREEGQASLVRHQEEAPVSLGRLQEEPQAALVRLQQEVRIFLVQHLVVRQTFSAQTPAGVQASLALQVVQCSMLHLLPLRLHLAFSAPRSRVGRRMLLERRVLEAASSSLEAHLRKAPEKLWPTNVWQQHVHVWAGSTVPRWRVWAFARLWRSCRTFWQSRCSFRRPTRRTRAAPQAPQGGCAFGAPPGQGAFGGQAGAGGNLFAQPNASGPPPGRRIVKAKRRAG
ncbi:unnamed protein product [Effrenium voratum]|nr:unnamed protein product [Effrenium voratum]